MTSRTHGFFRPALTFVLALAAAAAVVAFARTAVVQAGVPGAAAQATYAGLRDGSYYVSGPEGDWHQLDPSQLTTMGLDLSTVTVYPALPALPQVELNPPAAPLLAGLPDGTYWVAGPEGDWHQLDPSQLTTMGLDLSTVTVYPALPALSQVELKPPAAPLLAGLPDGTYWVAGPEGDWHQLDPSQLTTMGLDLSTVTVYPALPALPQVEPAQREVVVAGLAGGTYWVAGPEGDWHQLDPSQLTTTGLDLSTVPVYPALPGP